MSAADLLRKLEGKTVEKVTLHESDETDSIQITTTDGLVFTLVALDRETTKLDVAR